MRLCCGINADDDGVGRGRCVNRGQDASAYQIRFMLAGLETSDTVKGPSSAARKEVPEQNLDNYVGIYGDIGRNAPAGGKSAARKSMRNVLDRWTK